MDADVYAIIMALTFIVFAAAVVYLDRNIR